MSDIDDRWNCLKLNDTLQLKYQEGVIWAWTKQNLFLKRIAAMKFCINGSIYLIKILLLKWEFNKNILTTNRYSKFLSK